MKAKVKVRAKRKLIGAMALLGGLLCCLVVTPRFAWTDAQDGNSRETTTGSLSTDLAEPFSDELSLEEEAKLAAGLDTGPWPMFRQNVRHTGRGKFSGTPFMEEKWDRWECGTGLDVYSSPTIGSDGTIYVGSDLSYLHAVSPVDGSKKWSYPTSSDVYSSPAIGAGGTIYIGSHDGKLHAVNPADGSQKWIYSTGSSVSSSPAIGADGTIYIGSHDGKLHAVNPDNGTSNWTCPVEDWGGGSPAIGTDGTIYVTGAYELHALNPTDGSLKWTYPPIHGFLSEPVIGADNTIYVNAGGELHAVNPVDGSLKWTYPTDGYANPAPAIGADGTIYLGAEDGYLHAVNPIDRSLKWTYQTGGIANSPPAIGADGTIYVGSNDSYLHAVNPDGSRKWKWMMYLASDSSSPAIGSDGTIYVVAGINHTTYSHAHLLAIGLPSGMGGLYGRITSLSTGNPVSSAHISVTGKSVDSNASGAYGVSLSPGAYEVTCSKDGYQSFTIPGVTITAGKFTKLDFELTIPGPLNIVTESLPPGEVGIPYAARVRIEGGKYPYTYAKTCGKLPPGLKLRAKNGEIFGKPTKEGSYTFCIKVQDAAGDSAQWEYSIEVTSKLEIGTPCPLPRATKSVYYLAGLEAIGGTPPYTFSKSAGSFPGGLALASDGKLSGIPSGTGTFSFTIKVADDSERTAEKECSLQAVDQPVIGTPALNDGIVGQDYYQKLSGTRGYGAYHWEVYSGVLPGGLGLDPDNGTLAGTPAEPYYGPLVISLADGDGRVTYKPFTLRVSDPLKIITQSLPTGLKGESYGEAIRLTGGIAPFTFTKLGNLPTGLTLNADGTITGTPSVAACTNFQATVTDSSWPTHQVRTQTLSLCTTSQLTITASAVLPRGRIDEEYSAMVLSAKGGAPPYTWSVTGGYLPEGITLDKKTGTLAGTPLDVGDFLFTVQVVDKNKKKVKKEFFLHVSDELTIITGAVPDGAVGVPFSTTLEAAGGFQPYAWHITNGKLPEGLSLSETTGTIYGTPTASHSISFTVQVNDSDAPPQAIEKTFVMEVLDTLYIYTTRLPNGRLDQPYQATIEAKLGKPPYSWRVASGILPEGLILTGSPSAASLEGTPSAAGVYEFALEVSDSGTPVGTALQSYRVEIFDQATITTEDLRSAMRGKDYDDTIVVAGGEPPYCWEIIDGKLPVGLTLNSLTGRISGVTNATSGYSSTFTVRVTDAGKPVSFTEKELVIYVFSPLKITTLTLPKGKQGSAYNATLAGQGGLKPYQWALTSGKLPEGVTLNTATGMISGTPSACGKFSFTVNLSDSAEIPNVATRSFVLEVLCPS